MAEINDVHVALYNYMRDSGIGQFFGQMHLHQTI